MLFFSAAAAIVALALGALWLGTGRTRGTGTLPLALAWGAYAGYEAMWATRWCTGDCNIRIDLLLWWPALVLGTLAWLGAALWRAWRRRGGLTARRPR